MSFAIIAFIAGILTALAPCTLPLLPVIIGGSVQGKHSRIKPFVIVGSLAISIVIFTLALKFSTAFIDVPAHVWQIISGTIIILMGVITIFPHLWEMCSIKLGLSQKSGTLLSEASHKESYWGDILVGFSLGPVFSSCSPTYFLILATVLPQSIGLGIVYLVVYAAGLSLILLLVAFLGQKFIQKVKWAANPNGWFKKIIGILFVLVGIFILTGIDKKIQTYMLDQGFFDITRLEQKLLE